MIRAVLDTNQFVSMVIRPGGLQDALRGAWREQRFTLVTSPPLLEELRRVLAYPRLRNLIQLTSEETDQLLRLVVEEADVTAGAHRVQVIAADPADDLVLACAVEGKVTHIVTGDKHLLSLHEYLGIRILTAREFFRLL